VFAQLPSFGVWLCSPLPPANCEKALKPALTLLLCVLCCAGWFSLQDMRAELLTGEQERELAVMVQDLLALEQSARDLAVKLSRTPTEQEWMEAAGAQGEGEDVEEALVSFKARLHAGRSAKSVSGEQG
jgi:hypothetical protein